MKNGRAVGAVANDGREFAAKDAVIAALHPHDLGKMVEGLAPEVVKAANATQISEVGCITVHAALKQPLKFRAGSHVKAVMIELLPNKYDTIRKSFDSIRYGEFSSYPLVGLGSLTMFDPSRAPAGAATMHAWDYVPYQRADGRGWDDTKHHYVKRMLNHMENFLDNLADNVLAYHSDSPVDMERTSSSFRRGDLHGIASVTYQSRRASADARSRQQRRAGLRAAVPRRPVPASGRRRVRRGPRGRRARVRGPEDRLRQSRGARVITLYSADNSKLMEIERLERSGSELLIRGKVFGAMPMTARLSPAEARKGLKLLNFKLAWFLLTFLLR